MRARVLLVFLTLFGMAEANRQAGRLPELVAVHFGADGAPNGWMTRAENLYFELSGHALILVIFLGVAALTVRLPPSMVNLPNRDYWLAPERLEQTRARLDTLTSSLGVAISLFFTWVTYLIYRVNMGGSPRLGGELPLPILILVVFMVGWFVVLYRSFRKPPGG